MTAAPVPEEAARLAKEKVNAFLGGPELHINDVERFISGLVDMVLAAAAPFIRAQALDELTANSPRLPSDVRNAVFEIVFDVINKFHFPVQNCGPHKDVVEAGDVCGDVEKRIVALLRARAVTERGGDV
jgi:hypothetical protein